MGVLTWIVVGIVVLAIIGLGWQTFFSGIVQGARKIGDNPVIENVTNTARDKLDNLTGDIVIMRPA
jgi:hypothetical protein